MPTTLTRSLLVILIPGLIASAPWLIVLFQHLPDALQLLNEHESVGNAALFAIAAVTGSVIEGLASYLEVWWDRVRERDYDVTEQWFTYLSRQLDPEPVGYRYLSRMVTTLYFELCMAFAAALCALGIGFALAHIYPSHACRSLLVGALVALGFFFYFAKEASDTHKLLCKTRKEMNVRTQPVVP
jgi:hypothetical protein